MRGKSIAVGIGIFVLGLVLVPKESSAGLVKANWEPSVSLGMKYPQVEIPHSTAPKNGAWKHSFQGFGSMEPGGNIPRKSPQEFAFSNWRDRVNSAAIEPSTMGTEPHALDSKFTLGIFPLILQWSKYNSGGAYAGTRGINLTYTLFGFYSKNYFSAASIVDCYLKI